MTRAQLQAFSLVAELQSFTLTAQQLGISQSAVSHALKGLERELGIALVERRRNQAVVTEAGAKLLPRVREMLGLAETIYQQASALRGMQQGSLRVGSFGPTASLRLIPKILACFQASYPGIQVQIDEGEDQQVIQWIEERRVDLGFVTLPNERFTTFPLIEDQMVVLVPESHPFACRSELSLPDLCEDPFILTEAGSSDIVQRLFHKESLSPHIRYRNAQLITTLTMVARGLGIAIVAEQALPPVEEQNGYLVKPLKPRVKRLVAIALHPGRAHSPATEAFVSAAKRTFLSTTSINNL